LFDHIIVDEEKKWRFFCLKDCDPYDLKRKLILLEENSPRGRLFDFDVYSGMVESFLVTRDMVSLASRECFLCNESSVICRRERRHSLEDLEKFVRRVIDNRGELFSEHLSMIASLGVAASIYEVLIYPKPGLVDAVNSGSHDDMNCFTFARSSSILWPYLYNCSLISSTWTDSPKKLMEELRKYGVECEGKMYEITGGINTHKGLIFLFGIIAAASSYQYSRGIFSVKNMVDFASKMVEGIVEEELAGGKEAKTGGEEVYIKYGITGIRGEVEGGFKTIVPLFDRFFGEIIDDFSINEVGLHSLLHIFTTIEDTNIICKNPKYMEKLRELSRKILDSEELKLKEGLLEIDNYLMEKKISPGGSGDMLASLFFIYLLDRYLT